MLLFHGFICLIYIYIASFKFLFYIYYFQKIYFCSGLAKEGCDGAPSIVLLAGVKRTQVQEIVVYNILLM